MVKKIKNLPTGLKFFLIMIAVYLAVGSFDLPYLFQALANLFKDLIEVIPILGLAFFMVFLINYFVKPETIKKHLGHDSGLRGWFYVLIGSVIISGPPYIILPILNELKQHGMKNSLLALFLNNRNVQPAFLPVMAYYFGWRFTIVISFYIILFAILTGIFIGRIFKEKKILI